MEVAIIPLSLPNKQGSLFQKKQTQASRDHEFFFFFSLCHLVVVLLSSLNLSVPQFSVCKLEIAFATNLPPGVSEGLMSWLPTLDPAEWCLTDSLNIRETEKDRWVASI